MTETETEPTPAPDVPEADPWQDADDIDYADDETTAEELAEAALGAVEAAHEAAKDTDPHMSMKQSYLLMGHAQVLATLALVKAVQGVSDSLDNAAYADSDEGEADEATAPAETSTPQPAKRTRASKPAAKDVDDETDR